MHLISLLYIWALPSSHSSTLRPYIISNRPSSLSFQPHRPSPAAVPSPSYTAPSLQRPRLASPAEAADPHASGGEGERVDDGDGARGVAAVPAAAARAHAALAAVAAAGTVVGHVAKVDGEQSTAGRSIM